MLAEVYILSGFLGAGKTTLLQKLLTEDVVGKKVAIIENDFGDISVDAALLKDGKAVVQEIKSGCICCTLTGDFSKAMQDLLKEYSPEILFIEPSGVGKLSDILKACAQPELADKIQLGKAITVVDIERLEKYMNNFGEFFLDQIEFADILVLSRTENNLEKVKEARTILAEVNPEAEIISLPDFHLYEAKPEVRTEEEAVCSCGHHHDEHEHYHEDGCCCGHHHHHADELFDTFTLTFESPVKEEVLRQWFTQLEEAKLTGEVLRVKGFVPGEDILWQVQYVPGELALTQQPIGEGYLSFIGHKIKAEEIAKIFSGGVLCH